MRATRAAIFAAMCVALGAIGHSSMSGTDIPFFGLLGAFGVTCGFAWLAAGRRRGPVGITAAVLSVQGVLHLVFSGSAAAAKPFAAPGPMHGHHPVAAADAGAMAAEAPGMADMAHMAGTAGMAGATGAADMAGMAGHGGAAMIAAHVLAGLLCAAWLARGEAAVFRLARVLATAALHAARPLARALALVRARVAALPAPPVFPAPYERPRRLRGAVHAHAVVRRGPPGPAPLARSTAPGPPALA
ncbi:hypothetical protein [Streptomyces xanthophaeus]|uniref:hypothetical protein n=1 Tax=Streptomyces xanthophaeus TaxID=67385 RepID=UPI002647D825|nr:hypothetical protein [Streptomyces xanthophaeus]WKD34966.1 hypothetical protein KO717_25545 [Streptomyces xanthophaeus]